MRRGGSTTGSYVVRAQDGSREAAYGPGQNQLARVRADWLPGARVFWEKHGLTNTADEIIDRITGRSARRMEWALVLTAAEGELDENEVEWHVTVGEDTAVSAIGRIAWEDAAYWIAEKGIDGEDNDAVVAFLHRYGLVEARVDG